MYTQFLKISGLAVGMLTLQLSGFSQQLVPTPGEVPDKDTLGKPHTYQEIIIRQKTDKDAKVTVEIRNGELFINGKPASEYEDGNLAIIKRKLKKNNNSIILDGGDMDMSPFREHWDFKNLTPQNKAFLGVTSMRKEDGPAGAAIAEVSPGSAAEKAGLKNGDLIIKVDELVVENPEDLVHAIGKYAPNDKVTITYKRDGKEQKVTVTLDEGKNGNVFGFMGPDGAGVPDENFFKQLLPPGLNYNGPNSSRLGIRAQDIEDGKGVKVLSVDGESAAARAGIKEKDIITVFDGRPVHEATALAEIARESRLKPSVHVSVLRDGKTLDLEIKNPRKLKTADL
jgi:serine protease Do